MSEEVIQSVAETTKSVKGYLIGKHTHSLDPKKRFTIPSEWREVLGNPKYVFVMPDRTERCLNIIPQEEMEARLAVLRQKALFDPQMAKVLRVIGANSEQLPLDVAGRIRVSDKLLRFANLKTTVAMVGAVRKIELWAPEALPPDEDVDQVSVADAMALAGF